MAQPKLVRSLFLVLQQCVCEVPLYNILSSPSLSTPTASLYFSEFTAILRRNVPSCVKGSYRPLDCTLITIAPYVYNILSRPGIQCPVDGPVVFYKTHKTGSTTMTNLLYRYSMLHQRRVFSPPGTFEPRAPYCQHYEFCLPKHGDKPLDSSTGAYDMALHHYHAVGDKRGIPESTGTWAEKWERYSLGAAMDAKLKDPNVPQPQLQLITILRDPAAAFFSKYDYFNLRRKAGKIKEMVVQPQHGNGETRDFGVYTDEQLEAFLQSSTIKSAFIFILEELELSLALWKVACGLSWHEIIVRQSNKNMHKAQTDKKMEVRMPLVKANHVRDYSFYNASVDKLHAAKASYPDQEQLDAAIKRIRATNEAANAECTAHPKEPFCILMALKPQAWARHVSPEETIVVDLENKPWEELGNTSVASALAKIKLLADSYKLNNEPA